MQNESGIKVFLLDEFKKDKIKYIKKYQHFKEDLERVIKYIKTEPINSHSPRISNLGKDITTPIYKLRKFRSLDIKGKGANSGFRIIYAFDESQKKITLIEIYHHKDKGIEDRNRIFKYFK